MNVNLTFVQELRSVSFVEKKDDKELIFASLCVSEGAFITVASPRGNVVIVSTDEIFMDALVELARFANYDFHYGKNWFECIASNGYSEVFNKRLRFRLNGKCADDPKYIFDNI